VTIVDVEQLGGAITEHLAALFEEEPKAVSRKNAAQLGPLPSVQGGGAMKAGVRRVREAVG